MEQNYRRTATITCRHCSHKYKIVVPEKSGTYKSPCPACGKDNYVRLRTNHDHPQNAPAAEKESAGTTSSSESIVTCPECEAKIRTVNVDKSKNVSHYAQCPVCHVQLKLYVENGCITSVEKKKTELAEVTTILRSAKLTLVRAGGILGKWGNKSFPLRMGNNVIGRHDDELPSDIAIKGDKWVSRRSVNIEVIEKENGYYFKMTVRNAKNPVMHNNHVLTVGEAVYLNYGDSIKLGKNTTFIFEKA